MYYSKITKGFYPKKLLTIYKKSKSLPSDLVEITEEYYDELFKGIILGMSIIADSNGFPLLEGN